MADLTLPLAEIPAYRPDGPVMVVLRDRAPNVVSAASFGLLGSGWSIILDPTGLASLARAIGTACGLDVSGGVMWSVAEEGPSLVLADDSGDVWFSADDGGDYEIPALSTIDPHSPTARAEALAAVARVVLAEVSRG